MNLFTDAQKSLRAPDLGTRIGGWIRFSFAFVFYFSTVLMANALQAASLLFCPFSKRLFRRFNRELANLWWGWCVLGAEKVFGVQPVITGDVIPEGENALVFANHQQMPDILAVMMLAWRKKRLGDMKWFVKDPIKYVPGIGWGMRFLDCLFVKRDWLADKRNILATFDRFLKSRIPIWLITFVEGTRLTPEKLQRSAVYWKRKGLPPTRYVMAPRTRGFTAAIEGLGTHLDAVYDVTIGYEGGVPSLQQIYSGSVKRIFLDVRRFPIDSLPKSEPELAQWLQERFIRKDQILDHFFKNGCFP